MQIDEVSLVHVGDLDEQETKVLITKLKGFSTNAEHHLNGAKGAKTRFSGVLNIKI